MAPSPREGSSRSAGDGRLRREDSWVIDLLRTLDGCINERAGTIFRVPEEIRKANKDKMDCYKPQFVAMGPFQRQTTIELQTMEFTKWSCVKDLFHSRNRHLLRPCRIAIEESESLIRLCDGENVEMQSEKFSMMMLQDACFLLKLLLWLYENLTSTGSPQNFLPVHIDDHKKMSRLLTDLILLENQIPFFLLIILSKTLIDGQGREEQPAAGLHALSEDKQLSPEKLACSLFQCDVAHADFSKGVYHFLYLIHSCASDPYQPQHYKGQTPLQLRRCARKLQALGIKIKCRSSDNEPVEEIVGPLNLVPFVVREFMDKFEFQIEFNEAQRELIIPTLHIKEATEVKWRNFIAWEQTGRLIEVGYKFTSYAYFFNGLVCSVHDIQLLKEEGVISVHTEAKDEDLLIMFQSIVAGAERLDDRYRNLCEKLNNANVNGVGGCCVLRMLWHYWLSFLERFHRRLISLFLSFMHTYCHLGVPWKFIGVVSGAALLGLTITQTIYAIRADAVKK